MSDINFNVLVKSLLSENVTQILTPSTGDSALDNIGALERFVGQLVFREGGYARQDTLITFKPIWPYADTFDFIRAVLVRAGFLKNDRDGVKKLARAFETAKPQTAQDLVAVFANEAPNVQVPDSLIPDIERKIQDLNNNANNYRNYFNTTLKQLNDETSVIAAEPYLDLTPQASIVQVLQDFGGYDIRTAEKIVMYPGENKYTQMGPNIGGIIMGSIIEISKLMLIFYREHIQRYSREILDHINYFLESTDRWYVFRGIDRNTLNELVRQLAGKKPPEERAKNIERISRAVATVGKEADPSDAVAKYIHDDYIAFLNGMSGLVLENYDFAVPETPENPNTNTQTQTTGGYSKPSVTSYSTVIPGTVNDSLNTFDKFYNKVFINEQNQPQPIPLIKTVNDFKITTGTGQQVYQAYLHLFNNMRKGEIPSKWQTGTKTGMNILGGLIGGLSDTFSKFKGI